MGKIEERPAAQNTPLLPAPESVPETLRIIPNWVLWGYEERESRRTKTPRQPNNGLGYARSNDERTWGTFEDAHRVAASNQHRGIAGIGFMLGRRENPSGIVGIDLDHCIHDGVIAELAQVIIRRMASYSEISPSGSGVRIFIKGRLPGAGNRVGSVEVYDS